MKKKDFENLKIALKEVKVIIGPEQRIRDLETENERLKRRENLLDLIWEKCPEKDCCDGHYPILMSEGGDVDWTKCPTCHGRGKVPRYWTPKEWEDEIGIECAMTAPVWNLRYFDFVGYRWVAEALCQVNAIKTYINLSVLGQPRPSEGEGPCPTKS